MTRLFFFLVTTFFLSGAAAHLCPVPAAAWKLCQTTNCPLCSPSASDTAAFFMVTAPQSRSSNVDDSECDDLESTVCPMLRCCPDCDAEWTDYVECLGCTPTDLPCQSCSRSTEEVRTCLTKTALCATQCMDVAQFVTMEASSADLDCPTLQSTICDLEGCSCNGCRDEIEAYIQNCNNPVLSGCALNECSGSSVAAKGTGSLISIMIASSLYVIVSI